MRHRLAERGCGGIELASAGTWGTAGSSATAGAVDAVRALGGDLSQHRSRELTSDDLGHADIVIAMTSVHLREIEKLDPAARAKTFLMKELSELEYPGEGRGIEDVLASTRPAPRRALDVDDPMGLPYTAYERCVGELDAGIRVLVDALCEAAK